MNRVLITGGTGFIGFHLAKYYLKKKYKVVLFDNLYKIRSQDRDLKKLLKNKNIKLYKINLTEKISSRIKIEKNFDTIFHFAAINGTSLFYKIPYKLCSDNSLITINFLKWLEENNIKFKSLIYSSTSEVYANSVIEKLAKIPTNEQALLSFKPPYADRFSYAISKFLGEYLVDKFLDKTKANGYIVRFHNIYGPRMGYKHVIPELINRINKSNIFLELYGGFQTRAFCYVEDAIVDLAKLSKKKTKKKNKIINIGNPKEVSIKTLSKKIMKFLNKKLKIYEKGSPQSSVGRRCPDIKKIKSLFKISYKRTNLDAGLKKTIQWYLK